MLVLGLESTCDETAAAIVRDGREILSNVVTSQIDLHEPFGGVVPELACRRHLEVFSPIIQEALTVAQVTLQEIDLISVAQGPGLIGALLIGLNVAKGLSMGSGKPLIGVNHVEAHLYAALMSHPDSALFPALGLVISGGHTALLHMKSFGEYTLISSTVDDALGEAFDKVASLLDLPYPGGPQVEKLAQTGDPKAYPFTAGRVKRDPLAFSFSGLKTNVLYAIKGQNADKHAASHLTDQQKADVAASFQEVALRDVVNKVNRACEQLECRSIIAGGGVTCNQRLRELFAVHCDLPILWPDRSLVTDNAAMIAGLGHVRYQLEGPSDLSLTPYTRVAWS
jgi:N6-L-threonylcarbamoyladenine synthase